MGEEFVTLVGKLDKNVRRAFGARLERKVGEVCPCYRIVIEFRVRMVIIKVIGRVFGSCDLCLWWFENFRLRV